MNIKFLFLSQKLWDEVHRTWGGMKIDANSLNLF